MNPKLSHPPHRREADGRSVPSHRGNIRHAELRQDPPHKPARDDKGYMMELVGKHIKGVVTKPEIRGTKYGHRREVSSPTSGEEDDDKEDEGEVEGDDDEGDEEEDSDESSSTQHSSGDSEDESPQPSSFEDRRPSNPSFVVLSVSRPRAIVEPPRAEQKALSEKERTPRTRTGGEGMTRGFRSQIKEIRRQKAGLEPSPERDSLEAMSEYEPSVESRPIATPERRRLSASLASQSPRDSSSPAGSPSLTSFVSSLPSLLSISSSSSSSQTSPTSDHSGPSSPISVSMSPTSPHQPTLITFNNPSTNSILHPSIELEKPPPIIITTPNVLSPSLVPLSNGTTITFNGPTISFTGPNFSANNFLANSSSLSSTTTTMTRPLSSSSLTSLVSTSLTVPARVNSPFNLIALSVPPNLGSKSVSTDSSPDSPSFSSLPPAQNSSELVLDGTLMIEAIIRSIGNLSNAVGVLNGQVDRFCAIVDKQTRDKNDHLMQVWDEVRKTVQGLWEGGVVETYGSFVTGLSLPSSDLDMVISAIGTHPKIIQMAVHALKRRTGLAADWQPSAHEWFERLTRPLEPWADTLAQELYERLLQDAASEGELVHPRAGRSTLVLGLLALALELREQPWVHNLNPITTAKVPVIKLNATVYDHPPVVVDISFTERTLNEGQAPPLMSDADGAGPGHLHFGTAAARLVQAYIQDWPHLKKLALVLKQFLYIQSLHDTYTGGLSSYCLVVMIVSFLQAASQTESLIPHASNQPHPCSQVAVLLIAFLDFYSERFDYKSTGIRVCLPSTYNHNIPGAVIGRNCAIPGSFQNFFKLPRDSPTLYIEDPFNPKNNIGQSVFQFWKVSQAFSGAHRCMVDALQGKDWQYCEALCLLVGQINVPNSTSLPLSLSQTLPPLSLTLPLSTTLLPPSLPMTLSLTAQPPVPLAAIQPAMLLASNGLIPYSDDLGHSASHVYSSQRRDRHGLRNGQHQQP